MQQKEQNKTFKPIIIIPSRISSVRLPKKALKLIDGKEMIWHVWSNAQGIGIGPVLVATDCEEIASIIHDNGGNAILTNKNHNSGSDRVYEALLKFDPSEKYDLIINLQGDMPFFDPDIIVNLLSHIQDEDITTLVSLAKKSEITDPNVVKVAMSWDNNMKNFGKSLYFSRSSIPFNSREYWHHIGIYAWKRNSLKKFISLSPSQLETIEKLEQLRALENGMEIKALKVKDAPIGVDTQKDLDRVRTLINNKNKSEGKF